MVFCVGKQPAQFTGVSMDVAATECACCGSEIHTLKLCAVRNRILSASGNPVVMARLYDRLEMYGVGRNDARHSGF